MTRTLLFYWYVSLERFYEIAGRNGSPAVGTLNHFLNLTSSSSKKAIRHLLPMPKDADVANTVYSTVLNEHNMPLSINGGESAMVIAQVTNKCPQQFLDLMISSERKNESELLALGWDLNPIEE